MSLADAIARNRARHAERAAKLAEIRARFSGPEWETVSFPPPQECRCEGANGHCHGQDCDSRTRRNP